MPDQVVVAPNLKRNLHRLMNMDHLVAGRRLAWPGRGDALERSAPAKRGERP
jgi:hypothetical protein